MYDCHVYKIKLLGYKYIKSNGCYSKVLPEKNLKERERLLRSKVGRMNLNQAIVMWRRKESRILG